MFSCLATSFCIGTNVFSPLLSQMLHIITKQNIPSLHSPTHWCTKSTGPGFGVFEAHTFLVHGTSSSRPLQKTWQVGSLGHGHGQGLLGCFFFLRMFQMWACFLLSLMLTAPFCKWFWSGLRRCRNTEPHRVFGAFRVYSWQFCW